ncbi:MAG: hypothetical protein EHM78_22995 [Myxococcaceae bacterium]|nr:MAG: hypothetical protein EHM78_22995 [Myxococcaceae bacterium]
MRRSRPGGPLLLLVAALVAPGAARAYPWMIRHGYSGCGVCHVDPSGAGLLTDYGRAQSDLLMATRWSTEKTEEASPTADFGFGLFNLPDWLFLGFSYRGGELIARSTTNNDAGQQQSTATDRRWVHMVADLRAGLRIGRFRASGTIGWLPYPASAISVTSNDENNVVAREFWAGWELGDEAGLVRGGRMNLPFGLRNVEHTAWIRSASRTDINDDQQYGVSLLLAGETVRGEIMAILGNYQLKPDDYRERGYSGYLEVMVAPSVALGVSSLVTRAERGLSTGVPTLRQAHGASLRWGILPQLGLLAEADVLLQQRLGTGVLEAGAATWTQLDWEPIQGFHVMPAFETWKQYGDVSGVSLGEWITLDWFPWSHLELRIDIFLRQQPQSSGSTNSLGALFQVHVLL